MSRSTNLKAILRDNGIVAGDSSTRTSLAREFGLPETHFTLGLLAQYERDAKRVFGMGFDALGAEERKRVVLNWIPPESGEIPKW